jgi:hypothetical protein
LFFELRRLEEADVSARGLVIRRNRQDLLVALNRLVALARLGERRPLVLARDVVARVELDRPRP